mmetsp:Transcript_3303/g.8353  ORF Transcript_3303/g.8353 Transcript_3303/m.8353 type:complete len:317 (+) Transcript_3303:339-1289(+)
MPHSNLDRLRGEWCPFAWAASTSSLPRVEWILGSVGSSGLLRPRWWSFALDSCSTTTPDGSWRSSRISLTSLRRSRPPTYDQGSVSLFTSSMRTWTTRWPSGWHPSPRSSAIVHVPERAEGPLASPPPSKGTSHSWACGMPPAVKRKKDLSRRTAKWVDGSRAGKEKRGRPRQHRVPRRQPSAPRLARHRCSTRTCSASSAVWRDGQAMVERVMEHSAMGARVTVGVSTSACGPRDCPYSHQRSAPCLCGGRDRHQRRMRGSDQAVSQLMRQPRRPPSHGLTPCSAICTVVPLLVSGGGRRRVKGKREITVESRLS